MEEITNVIKVVYLEDYADLVEDHLSGLGIEAFSNDVFINLSNDFKVYSLSSLLVPSASANRVIREQNWYDELTPNQREPLLIPIDTFLSL